MRRATLLVIPCFVAVGLGCSKDSTTGPEENEPYTLEGSETIGPDGGVLESEEFSLTVPEGAFSAEHQLQLYRSTEDRPYDERQVTGTFRLEGLPDSYDKPLRVSIAYEGTLEDEVYIAQGLTGYDPFLTDSITVHRLYAATDSVGYLVGELTASSTAKSAAKRGSRQIPSNGAGEKDPLDLLGIDATRTKLTEHFRIRYPAYLVAVDIDDVANLLEESYQVVIDDLHLDFEEGDWYWPIDVVIRAFPPLRRSAAATVLTWKDPPLMELNQEFLSQGNYEKVRLESGKRLFCLALDTYEILWDDAQGPYTSFNYAVADWSEEKLTHNQDYQRPEWFPGNEMAPFDGMWAGTAGNVASRLEHGHGMAAVIKYLVEDPRFGEFGIRNTYVDCTDGQTLLPTAFQNNVNALVADWWPDFFKSYVAGEVYGVGSDVFTDDENLAGVWTIADRDDEEVVLTERYEDLSAKLFLINLSYPSIDESAALMIELEGEAGTEPVSMLVFGAKDGPLDYWDRTTGQSEFYQIDNLRSLMSQGWRKLLVVVVNSESNLPFPRQGGESSEISLKLKVSTPLQYNRGSMQIKVVGYYRETDPSGTLEYAEDFVRDVVATVGTTVNNVFTGSSQTETTRSHLTVAFNSSGDSVLTASFERTYYSSGLFDSTRATCSNIPFAFVSDGHYRFSVEALETCGHVDHLELLRSYGSEDDPTTIVMTGFECDEYDSSIDLYLWKE